jgi:prevent-host-death family protein
MQVNIYDAKTKLSQLVDAAHRGEVIVIAKAGTPMAKLVPLSHGPKPKIKFGLMKGQFVEAEDFDAPLPDEVLAAFEGRSGEPNPRPAERSAPQSRGGRRKAAAGRSKS